MSRYLTDFAWKFSLLFFGLYILTLSFGFALLPDGSDLFGGIMHACARFTGDLFFDVNLRDNRDFFSDSLLQYVHVFNLVLISVVIAVIWTLRGKKDFASTRYYPALLTGLRYFLALMLLIYGFGKIYKWQFYLPEPNTLYQTVGNTPRDLLYWTSMGTSYTYSFFMGAIEVIPAFLLLFRRTTLIGALISSGVLLNVVFVNLGFDITVKIHSFVLLMMSAVLVLPAWKRLVAFFSGRNTEAWSYPALSHFDSAQHDKHTPHARSRWPWRILKFAVIVLTLIESNYRYIAGKNFNDDLADRIPMHGAYEVVMLTYFDGQSTQPTIAQNEVQRLFIHNRGYIIFQYKDGRIDDYPITVDTTTSTIIIDPEELEGVREEMKWSVVSDSLFDFESTFEGQNFHLITRKLDWKKLPLLQEEFRWIDEQ